MVYAAGDIGHLAAHNALLGTPLGTLGYAQVVATQSGITSITDLTSLSAAVTVGSGRRVSITAYMPAVTSTVNGDYVGLYLYEGATQLQLGLVVIANATFGVTLATEVVLTPSAGAHTYKARLARVAGTGSISITPTATSPAFIHVKDVGV